jgi:hypothetical protein
VVATLALVGVVEEVVVAVVVVADHLSTCASPLVGYLDLCTRPSAPMLVLFPCLWMLVESQTHRPI